MTTRFRIDAIRIDTTEGTVTYEFPADIVVLTGPTGVGKTTLFELVKFGFGGRGKLAPVVRTSVIAIQLDLTVGNSRYTIKRSVDADKARVVQVTDLVTRERLPEHYVDRKKAPSLNSLLMGALGLPDDVRAAEGAAALVTSSPSTTSSASFTLRSQRSTGTALAAK